MEVIRKIEKPITNAKLNSITNITYKMLPQDNDEFLKYCNALMKNDDHDCFWLVTAWIKKRKQAYAFRYFHYYEEWLYSYVRSWGTADRYCYRVLNPVFELNDNIYSNVKKWADCENPYVRRAAAVCFIQSSRSFRVTKPLSQILEICDILKKDAHLHVKKGVGWLLKYAYLSYPDEIIDYLMTNANLLSRISYRYALEKMPIASKMELLNYKG